MECSFNVLCDFHVDFEFKTPLPVTRDIVNGIINANWRKLKQQLDPDLSKYTCQIIRKVIAPILAKVPIKDFFKKSTGYYN